MRIDLNSDLGESFGPWTMGQDEALMPSITSANIACGFHAGDPTVMRRTVALARRHGVAIGAHPGFPDLAGFGRRAMQASPAEVEDFVIYQVGALAGIAQAEGLTLRHVKPHGALYLVACRDHAIAGAIARAVAAIDRSLILFGLSGSALVEAGRAAGLRVAVEGFADRAYEPDGTLASRQRPGSVIHDPAAVVARAVRMVRDREVVATDGAVIRMEIDTLCLHGDTTGAAGLAVSIRRGLEEAGVTIAAVVRA
ncbi:MAG: 5-oxoprolinase subunit PxpA [Vicinamibacterales bacterium]|nr:5-oxoprolinase subunit PxpA [Vicinamibacterales bacterium]